MCLGGCEHIEHHLGILKRYYYFFGLYKEPVKANEVSLSLKTIYCISCQQKDESPIDEKKRPSKILFHTSQGSGTGTITIVTIWVKKIVDLIFPQLFFWLVPKMSSIYYLWIKMLLQITRMYNMWLHAQYIMENLLQYSYCH